MKYYNNNNSKTKLTAVWLYKCNLFFYFILIFLLQFKFELQFCMLFAKSIEMQFKFKNLK